MMLWVLARCGVAKHLPNAEEKASHVSYDFIAHPMTLPVIRANVPPELHEINPSRLVGDLSVDLRLQRAVGVGLEHPVQFA